MQIFMLNVKESLRAVAKRCESLALKALQRLLHFVNPPKPENEDNVRAASEIIEQVRVPKKRGSGSQSRKAGQTGSRHRVQRQAKGRSKKR